MIRDPQESRPYIEHLRIEHRRLNEKVRGISRLFEEYDEEPLASSPERVVETLSELRNELSRHFAEEEWGGCLEEAVCRCPSLSPAARRVELEHPFLLQSLDDLIESASGDATFELLQQDFADFAKTLRHHESAENRILQMGFGMAEDPKD